MDMRTALYLRVSTKAQDVESQRQALQEYAEGRDDMVLAGEYVDVVSGAKETKEELEALTLAVKRRQIDAVLFFDLSRLTRRGIVHGLRIIEGWSEAGCKVICYQMPDLDTTTPTGQLLASLLLWVGSQEREMIRARVSAGIAVAKTKGKRLGRPPTPVKKQMLARGMRENGASYRAIAKELDISVASAHRFAAT